MQKIEWIKKRAQELWEAAGRSPEREQDCWDQAVEEFEAGESEDQRGPVRPDPEVDKTGSGQRPGQS
jgi:Protein of unknown function (DUF2934)